MAYGELGHGMRNLARIAVAGLIVLLASLAAPQAKAAQFQQIPFCQPFATSSSNWTPARQYCSRAAPGYSPYVYGSFTAVTVATSRPGLRHCAIIDVYRRSPAGLAHRYKDCQTTRDAFAAVTNTAYTNPFAYFMIALAYNGSDSKQGLSGFAFGYKL